MHIIRRWSNTSIASFAVVRSDHFYIYRRRHNFIISFLMYILLCGIWLHFFSQFSLVPPLPCSVVPSWLRVDFYGCDITSWPKAIWEIKGLFHFTALQVIHHQSTKSEQKLRAATWRQEMKNPWRDASI